MPMSDEKRLLIYREWRDLCVDMLIERVANDIVTKHGGTLTSNISNYCDMIVVVVKVIYPKVIVRYEVEVPHEQIIRVYDRYSIGKIEYERHVHVIYAREAVAEDDYDTYAGEL